MSRAELDVQAALARSRSWDVKTARDVLRLPGACGQRAVGMGFGERTEMGLLCDMLGYDAFPIVWQDSSLRF